MNGRFTDQDVAALFCALRDAFALHESSWWARLRDLFSRDGGRERRARLASKVYRTWQEERPSPVDHDAVRPLDTRATNMALAMVRAQRRGDDYAKPRVIEVQDAG